MTNTGGTPAGWYYAPGDPQGTQRYWDGAQWIGEPQPVPQAPPAAEPGPADDEMTVQYRPPGQTTPPPTSFDAPGAAQSPGGFAAPGAGAAPDYSAAGAAPAPNYGVPGGQPVGAAPPGYQGFAAPSTVPGPLAEWGTRAIALLIDWAIGVCISIVGLILILIGYAIADPIGILMILVSIGASLAYGIWNFLIRQGATGQTIGKEKRGIKLVKDDTAQPVGAGMAFVRYLVAGGIGSLCGLYTILDYLWPLWDDDNKRLTDKIVTMSVVVA